MRHTIIALFFCVATAMASDLLASDLAKLDAHINAGFHVEDLKTNQVLYEHGGMSVHVPASTTKVLTSLVALDVLGPDFRYQTDLKGFGVQKKHTWHGQIELSFHGDPTLHLSDLRTLLLTLKTRGINHITDGIYLVIPDYLDRPYPPGMMEEDESEYFGSAYSSAIIERNTVPIRLRFAKGWHVTSPMMPHLLHISVKAHRPHDQKQKCVFHTYWYGSRHFILSDCIRPGLVHIGMHKIPAHTQRLVMGLLNELGIKSKVKVVKIAKRKAPQWQKTHRSKPLSEMIQDMLKRSDNMMAHAFFASSAYHLKGHVLSWYQAADVLKKHLEMRLHFSFSGMVWVDGAGVSRYNLVSASWLASLLKAAYKDPFFKKNFWPLMPQYALKDQLTPFNASIHQGFFYAKTGSMTGAGHLVGLWFSPDHHPIVFAIMIEGVEHHRHAFCEMASQMVHHLYQAR